MPTEPVVQESLDEYVNRLAQELDVSPKRIRQGLQNLEARGLILPTEGEGKAFGAPGGLLDTIAKVRAHIEGGWNYGFTNDALPDLLLWLECAAVGRTLALKDEGAVG
jgi:hypothetical protein